jgi:hypothetical protein
MHPIDTTITTPTTTPTTTLTEPTSAVPGRLARAAALLRGPHRTDADNADRAARLALVSARITGAWRLIVAAAVEDLTLPEVLRHAVVIAECDARQTARFWCDTAHDWRARAEHRPTSDTAGALSNWHELGVTA